MSPKQLSGRAGMKTSDFLGFLMIFFLRQAQRGHAEKTKIFHKERKEEESLRKWQRGGHNAKQE